MLRSTMASATVYDDGLTLREARSLYFLDNDFGADGNYDARWVKVKLGPIPVAFPNTEGRLRAVRYHDVHHVLTGYSTTLAGEAEIGAWELATDCRVIPAAWVLNLLAMTAGLFIAPGRVFDAFVRGRASRNLYREAFDDALLERRVGDERRRLGLDSAARESSSSDRWAFVGYATVGLLAGTALVTVLAAPLVGLVLLLLE